MPASAIVLFVLTVLIWGSTWLGIKFQLGEVEPLVSVIYRFGLAATLLFAWCLLAGVRMRVALREHGFLALQGLCLFGLNYWLFYLSSGHLTSGVVAVIFSSLVFMNIFNGWLFLRRPLTLKVLLAGVLGVFGVGLLFYPELGQLQFGDSALRGLLLGLLATFSASLGNIVATRNSRSGLKVIAVNAWGMFYGTLLLLVLALLTGAEFRYSSSPAYTLSLLYLAVFGSIVAFGAYLRLLGEIGPDRAAHTSTLFPVVALLLSTLFEGYSWTLPAIIGLGLILSGNLLVLRNTTA